MNNEISLIQDTFYPVKVWFTSIVSATLVFVVYDIWGDNNSLSAFLFLLPRLLIANILLGIPSLVFFFLGFNWLNNSHRSLLSKKIVLIIFAFSLFIFTWIGINALFGRHVYFYPKSLFIYGDFLVCIIISSQIYAKSTSRKIDLN